MRTARNIFIATLALADLTLCVFTTPMTLVDILTKYWPFGVESFILCKVVRAALAVTVFFSSFTIAIIAIDRHRFIVTPSKRQV
jgi:neuropeptide Y receptor